MPQLSTRRPTDFSFCHSAVFLTIREFCDEYSEDTLAVSQMLSPNCTRKIPFRLADKGLRYATDEEVANKLRDQESPY